MGKIYLILICASSFITFCLYYIDKRKAIKNKRRISEKTLLLASVLFGALGGLLAMYGFRHKTKHFYFTLVNVLSLALHVILYIYLFN